MDTGLLYWQLRSGNLMLLDGRIVPNMNYLGSATPGTMAVIRERCEEINRIIDELQWVPTSIDELTAYFSRR